MKILKLLNSSYFSILLAIILICSNAKAEDEPIDIWNIDQNKIEETKINNNQNSINFCFAIVDKIDKLKIYEDSNRKLLKEKLSKRCLRC